MSASVDFVRQMDLFSPTEHGNTHIDIIGAGGIGSFTAIALAKLGMTNIRVFDADNVASHNIPNQFHLLKAVGYPKVRSLKTLCKELAGVDIEVVPEFWTPLSPQLTGIVIAAVDHIRRNDAHPSPGREELWNAIKLNPAVPLLIDARIGGETIRVISIRPTNDIEYWPWYERQLFPEKEIATLPCTARSIIDVGFLVGAIITNFVRKYLKDGIIYRDAILSVGTNFQVIFPEVEASDE
jgi:hypothetical protein